MVARPAQAAKANVTTALGMQLQLVQIAVRKSPLTA